MAAQYVNRGMLGDLFSPDTRDLLSEEQNKQNELKYLAGNGPFAPAAYTAYKGAALAGQGLGGMIASAGGMDARAPGEVQTQAIAAAKAELAKQNFDMTTPKGLNDFYRALIQILASKGLAPEAAMMAKEWRAAEVEQRKGDLANSVEARRLKEGQDRDLRAQERNAAITEALGTKGAPIIQAMKRLDQLRDSNNGIGDPVAEAQLEKYIEKLASDSGVILENLGGTMKVIKKGSGDVVRTDEVTPKPNAAANAKLQQGQNKANAIYDAAHLQMQGAYDASVLAYEHRGLDNAVGPTHGMALKSGDVDITGALLLNTPGKIGGFTKAGVDFRAIYKRVLGDTFIRALKQLKDASPTTGASGLGNLSNMEGDKIQAAQAALDPLQYPPQFRRQLLGYINLLIQAWDNVSRQANREGIETQPLKLKENIEGQLNPAPIMQPAASLVKTQPLVPVTPAAGANPAGTAAAPAEAATPGLPQAPGWGVQWGTPVRKQ